MVARRRKIEKPNSVILASDLASLSLSLIKQSKWTEAEPLLRECLAIREKAIPDDWSLFSIMSQLGGALIGQGKYPEAEPLVLQGFEGLKARRKNSTSGQAPPVGSGGPRGSAVRIVGQAAEGPRMEGQAGPDGFAE